jgi:hypothetical protein
MFQVGPRKVSALNLQFATSKEGKPLEIMIKS